jgi:hypothetical protein
MYENGKKQDLLRIFLGWGERDKGAWWRGGEFNYDIL